MKRVVLRCGVALACGLLAMTAWAEPDETATPAQTTPTEAPDSPSASGDGCESNMDRVTSSNDFSRAVERHWRLVDFTRRLLKSQEQAAFEEAVARYQRLVEFTRRLERERQLGEQSKFEKRVEDYVAKRRFTIRLLDRRTRERQHLPPTLTAEPDAWIEPSAPVTPAPARTDQ